MTAVPLASLPSRMPLHPRRTSERVDPYWSSLWRVGSSGEWFSEADYRRLSSAGVAKAPAWLRMNADDARERVLSDRNRERVLRVVAALDQWRTMTVEQLEALADIPGVARGEQSLISAMWNAGLIEVCALGSALTQRPTARGTLLLRPSRPGDVLRELLGSLSYAEWVSVTAGRELDANRQFTRHNVLATELGLRVAEYGHASMVLGEKLSDIASLAYSGVGHPVPSTGVMNGSDLTLVRADGLRVAVELTASKVGGWFYEKVEKLVATLHRRPLAETGLCVLFVVAPHQDAGDAETSEVMKIVKRSVQKAVRAFPGTALDQTAMRVGVASWREMFPGAHSGTKDFGRLPIERPTGPGFLGDPHDERVWERGFFLDPSSTPLRPAAGSSLTAVMSTASGLRGVPHPLRANTGRPDLTAQGLHELGLERVPQIDGTAPVSSPRGGSGARGIPARLRF